MLDSWGQSNQPFLSSYDLIYICLKYKHPKLVKRFIKCLSWKEAHLNSAAEFIEENRQELRSETYQDNQSSIDHYVMKMNSLIKQIVEQCVPAREFLTKHKPAPWITPDLRAVQKDRDKCYRNYKRYGNQRCWENDLVLRRRAQSFGRKKNQITFKGFLIELRALRTIGMKWIGLT